MNKKIVLFSMALLAGLLLVNAQSGYGIKAGISYNSNGELKEITSEVSDAYKDGGKGKSGYNIGFYGKLDLGPIYLRPELVYTKTTSEYELNSGAKEDYKVSKLDMPVLIGFKLIGPLNIFAGPAFQYILDNDLKGIEISNVKNNFTIGMNIGASVEFGRLGIDVRYERGLSSNEANWTKAANTFTLDSRPEQLIFSLSYRLSSKKEY
jgi:hypothetical protein